MKKRIVVLGCVLLSFTLRAQIGHGGLPYSFNKYQLQLTDIPVVSLPVKSHALLLEEETKEDKSKAYKFGENIAVYCTPDNCGIWEEFPDGSRLWRVKIQSQGAYSLNFVFDSFYIPSHSRLYIYTADKQYVAGAFTAENNNAAGDFATALFPGDEVVLEYYEAACDRDSTRIVLSSVIHAYKDMKGYWGDSDDCNIDINCPQGSNMQIQKRAVVLILRYNYAHCTGTLMNNVRQDGTPYLLTANHCVEGYEGSLSRFVFVFNYEAVSCNSSQQATVYSINGATCLARYAHSDFCLLLLSSVPTQEMTPYYAGWNARSELPVSAVGIHHPSGDMKKISVADNKFSYSKYETDFPNNTHIQLYWAQGTTEGGSSGSPLFNQDKLVVGQLEGGYAGCDFQEGEDLYGRLAYSWTNNNNSSASKRLDCWLDADSTGTLVLQGYDPYDTLGVHSPNSTASIKAYPNPASQKISMEGVDEDDCMYGIYDIKGQCVSRGVLNSYHSIDVSLLKQGMYMIRIKGELINSTIKVLIQR
ncbi:MAG: trypsin-like peptidase domain-containing protein [Bacteroidales bacterium]|nr:trypsin-like peptidase domain-containing protein [Bacteroidales bacterium]